MLTTYISCLKVKLLLFWQNIQRLLILKLNQEI